MEDDAAARMWRTACGVLLAPGAERAWQLVCRNSPPDTVWHSPQNCVAHQADVWTRMLAAGAVEVMQPAAFKLAIVLRHTPPEVALNILAELLSNHPQSQDLTSYVLALLTDDEATGNDGGASSSPGSAAPLRDLQLFGDCELAVLAAPAEVYARHSDLVRAEYAQLADTSYIELRLKTLHQLTKIPRLYHTPEFAQLERAARDNVESELLAMRAETRHK